MVIKKLVVGSIETNCYILSDGKSSEAIVVDPGADYEDIKAALDRNNLIPKFIVNTHGHIDHTGSNNEFNIPVYIHKLDADFLESPEKNLSSFCGASKVLSKPSRLLEDGDIVELNGLRLEVMHTPGHTPGCICLKSEDAVLTGDTLFFEGIGRTDLPGGTESYIIKSIKERLFTMDDKITIYPGHGPESSIGHEKKNNPFIICESQ